MMHDSMTKKLDMLIDRQAEIQNLLIQPETSNDINLLTELNKEFADINPIAELYSEHLTASTATADDMGDTYRDERHFEQGIERLVQP